MSDHSDAIRTARDSALAGAGVQHATDDFKPAAQAVHQAARVQLKLSGAGKSTHSFMRDILALLPRGSNLYLRCGRGVVLRLPSPCGQASLAVHTLGRTLEFYICPTTLELAGGRDR